jgi:hypothetical protein
MYDQPPTPSLTKFAGLAILVLLPLIYGIIALNTGDLLWISPVFNARPQAVVIHCFGTDMPLEPGSKPFRELTEIFNRLLSGRKRWDSLSLSSATYQDYQTHPQMMALELFYAPAVRVHSPYKFFSKVDSIIIPLQGRHAQTNAIFGRYHNLPVAGSFHIGTTAPLVEYLAAQGLCARP